jgi:uncharacterized RDD family membrane protein YckC
MNSSFPPATYVVFDRGLTFQGMSRTTIIQQLQAGQLSDGAMIREIGTSSSMPVKQAFPELTQANTVPPLPSPGLQTAGPASIRDRAWAYFLDLLIVGTPLCVYFCVGSFVSLGLLDTSVGTTVWLGVLMSTVALWMGYPIYALASEKQATYGMAMRGLKLVDRNGNRPTLRMTSRRTSISYVMSGCFLMGFIWACFDRQKRTLHDLLTGTRVVKYS